MLKRATKPAARAEYEAELTGPPIPPALEYLWGWFHELHRTRSGGMGPGAIAYPDILAWCRLRGVRLAPWEVEIITALDGAWLGAQARKG